jgi:uncharacterized protein YndB with AHSA1/START domain
MKKEKILMADQIESSTVIERSYKAELSELWSLWTTKDGFESWWGPEGFRADVVQIDARLDGTLHYEMVADSQEMIAAMKDMGHPGSTTCKGRFSAFEPHERLALSQLIDFLPGIDAYESLIEVEFIPASEGHVRMIVTMHQMHDAETTNMQQGGFMSQLTKLDRRYDWQG